MVYIQLKPYRALEKGRELDVVEGHLGTHFPRWPFAYYS